jgi:hypothetical protein
MEYIRGYLKQHDLGNFCARIFGELTHHTRDRCGPCNVDLNYSRSLFVIAVSQ